MQHYATQEKSPKKRQFKRFIKKLNLPKAPGFDKSVARQTSILLNNYLINEELVDQTPSVLSNGNWTIGAGPDDFARILKESNYAS